MEDSLSLLGEIRKRLICFELKWCVASHWSLSPDQWLLNHQDPILAAYGLQPTGGPIGRGSYHSAEVQSVYSTAPIDKVEKFGNQI